MSDSVEVSAAEVKPPLAKRILRIALSVVQYFFIALCVVAVIIVIVGKKDANDGAITVFGHQMRTVLTGSMEKSEQTDVSGFDIKSIPRKAMVFIETVPEDPAEAKAWYDGLREGDVLTFRYVYSTSEVITHRIVEREAVEGGWIITLEGDNNSAEYGGDQQVIDTTTDRGLATNYVIGKVVHVSPVFGWFISSVKEPLGMALIIILPCLLIIVLEAVKIARVLGEEKRRRLGAEHKEKDDKIAELERRLAELSAKNSSDNNEEK